MPVTGILPIVREKIQSKLNNFEEYTILDAGELAEFVVFIPFVPNLPAMIIELKHNKRAKSALDQIKEKKYFDSLKDYKGGLLFVGMNYDEKDKPHECRIERFEKWGGERHDEYGVKWVEENRPHWPLTDGVSEVYSVSIMGMDNDGMPLGINKSLIQKMKKDFVNTLNSPDKMSPTLYLEIEEIEYSSGTTLLWVFVPPAATVIKCINRIYDRNEDGDMDITDSPIQVENLYILKSGSFSEKRIFPYVTEAELRMDLFDNIRQLAKSHNTNHPWITMTDKEIITSAGLFEKDYDSGEQGYNLAAILLLWKDQVIQSCVPGYITDALCRVDNLDRYDDRLQVKKNLIESYDLLMDFVAKHTADKFYLINNVNNSIRNLIAREVVGNILVHREYTSAFSAKIIIEKDWLKTENWCLPRRHGKIMSDEFTPYPKNPLIQNFFANIGRTDSIGSGVRNLYKYTPIYSNGGKPELYEDDVFRVSIPLSKAAVDEINEKVTLTDRQQVIYDMICANQNLSVEQVMTALNISRATVFREYKKIKRVTGVNYSKKTGTWTIGWSHGSNETYMRLTWDW